MDNSKKRNIKLAGLSFALILAVLACSVNLTNPAPSTGGQINITQTYDALSTQMALNQSGQSAQPAGTAQAPAPAATIDPCAQVVHTSTPPEPPSGRESGMVDKNDAAYAGQHHAYGGSENYNQNLYERPFTANVMDYLADIDIIEGQLDRSGDWVFITLIMSGQNTAGGMKGAYGVEVDSNIDGRGDFIVYVLNPSGTQWSTKGVKAYQDTNKDVGGRTPVLSDTAPGNGFDTLIFDEGCSGDVDAAWGRISPANASAVQLAFKWTLIKNNSLYLWGAWAGVPEMLNPVWFDYNDHFTHDIAGSSLIELTNYYPLKAFWGWDNTCRWIVGKKYPDGTEPGLCPYTPPEEKSVCAAGVKCP